MGVLGGRPREPVDAHAGIPKQVEARLQDTTLVSTAKRLREAAEARGPVATRERRAGGADNCEYERAVRLKPATVVRRSVKGVAWSESALLAQSSDLSASECDIRVSTGVGALLII